MKLESVALLISVFVAVCIARNVVYPDNWQCFDIYVTAEEEDDMCKNDCKKVHCGEGRCRLYNFTYECYCNGCASDSQKLAETLSRRSRSIRIGSLIADLRKH
ncbi:hypothetical protein AB6A40_004644 [Gnathostoma spinigerum]|uniref:Uncharacterized protein n=1 Tax=Gnathostoma spinigerum TaxID=75299 RepID=A0ABD6EE84_9BILA